jgi:hypothetical protein
MGSEKLHERHSLLVHQARRPPGTCHIVVMGEI